ncbi:hypothetical protein ACLOJK_032916 [Asimina triloba]
MHQQRRDIESSCQRLGIDSSTLLRMGDHFVFLVNRLITESTIEDVIESRKQLLTGQSTAKVEFSPKKNLGKESSLVKLEECRICQDEDEVSNMETPCSCCGSLKTCYCHIFEVFLELEMSSSSPPFQYAHRKCVQRWCNEKGDIVCEICHQQFKPGYTAPPRLFQYTRIPLNLRRNWEISGGDLRNPRFIAMVATDHDFVDDEEDDYSSATTRSMICCRSVAVIVSSVSETSLSFWTRALALLKCRHSDDLYLQFMVLLVLRHTFPIIVNRAEDYSSTIFILLLLRTAGILVPVYIMARALTAICRWRQLQESDGSDHESTREESVQPGSPLQPQSYVINIR